MLREERSQLRIAAGEPDDRSSAFDEPVDALSVSRERHRDDADPDRQQVDPRLDAIMDKLVQEKKPQMANMTAVEDLKTYEDFTKAHLDGMKNLRSSFESLYSAMPDAQKKNADKVFQSYGPNGSGQQG